MIQKVPITMWRCNQCQRLFKAKNQSHSCTDIDMGELFLGKPDDLVLAFDKILQEVAGWAPNEVATAKHSIVFTSKKAWLIVKPMKSVLNLKFYYGDTLHSERIKNVVLHGKKMAHNIRVKNEYDIDEEIMQLLKKGFQFSIQ